MINAPAAPITAEALIGVRIERLARYGEAGVGVVVAAEANSWCGFVLHVVLEDGRRDRQVRYHSLFESNPVYRVIMTDKAEAGKIKVSDLRIVAGEHEFPMAEILQAVENHYVEAFDRVVAATVKEVVFEAQLDSVRDVLDNLSSRVNDLKDDLNGEVGRKIEKVLGPNAFWSESSGTC